MRFRVLGPVTFEGGEASTASPSQRAVLAALLAAPGGVVPVDVLIDALWGDEPPPTARTTLRTYVSRLRRVLGDGIVTESDGYRLAVDPDEVDSIRFERLLERAAASDPVTAAATLHEALALWRGRAFGDCADLEAVRAQAARLELRRGDAREALAAALLAAGQPGEAGAAAQALVEDEPYREGAWTILVRALAAGGRRTDALRAYQRATAVLADVGLEPSAELKAAERAALEDAAPAAAPPAPPAPARPSGTASVAPPAARVRRGGRLVGRDHDLEAVADLLAEAQVVTLVGFGGVGKTRLAGAIVERVQDRFGLGARIVELAPIDDADSVGPAVVDALGLSMEHGLRHALAHSGGLDALLVLDNCEHVADRVAELVDAIVEGGTTLRVLATSRERLGVGGEHVWRVEPLDTARERSDARDLFLERAHAANPSLRMTDEVLQAADRIVARVDGLPLAIEMAAARLTSTAPRELADLLDERVDVLRAATRQSPHRHRSLAAVLDWSDALLDDESRTCLYDMAAFAGGVVADDVAAVLGAEAAHQHVGALVDRSLLVADVSGDRTNYRMLETVRAHVEPRLLGSDRGEAVLERHGRWVRDAIVTADAQLRSPYELDAVGRFEQLFVEARAAHHRARTRDPDLAAELTIAMHVFSQSRLRSEAYRWAEQLLADASVSPRLLPGLKAVVAADLLVEGRVDEAGSLARDALDGATDPGVRLAALDASSDHALFSGRLADARALALALVDAATGAGDTHYQIMGTANAALALSYGGDPDTAWDELVRAESIARSPSEHGWLAYARGEVLGDRDAPGAIASLDHAVSLASGVSNHYLVGVARVSLASLHARSADPQASIPAFVTIVEHWQRRGSTGHQVTTLRNLVPVLCNLEAYEHADRIVRVLDRHARRPSYGSEQVRLDDARERIAGALGASRALREPEGGSIEDAAAIALEALAALGGAAAQR